MSAPIVRIGDLEINQDLHVQERMWKIQRAGWAAMVMIVLLGAAGLFGHGPVSQTSAGDIHGPLWVEYERFGRYQSSSLLRVHLNTPNAPSPVLIWVSSAYLAGIEIQQITPSPSIAMISDGGVLFQMDTAGREESGLVTFSFQFQSIGRLEGEIRVPGASSAQVRHFVYP